MDSVLLSLILTDIISGILSAVILDILLVILSAKCLNHFYSFAVTLNTVGFLQGLRYHQKILNVIAIYVLIEFLFALYSNEDIVI